MKSMPNFRMPKITGYRAQNKNVTLQDKEVSAKVSQDLSKIEVEKNSEVVGEVTLKGGEFEKLSLGISPQTEDGDQYAFKDANLTYSAESVAVITDGQKSVCQKKEGTELPDIILTEDGKLGVLDPYYTCQPCHNDFVFYFKDSGQKLLNKDHQQISPWNAVDFYLGSQMEASYQGKPAAFIDKKEFYLATSGKDLRIVEGDEPNFTKAKMTTEDCKLSDIKLKVSFDQDKADYNGQLICKDLVLDQFSLAKSPISQNDQIKDVIDFLEPISDEIVHLTNLIC